VTPSARPSGFLNCPADIFCEARFLHPSFRSTQFLAQSTTNTDASHVANACRLLALAVSVIVLAGY